MAILSERRLWDGYARWYDGLLDFIPYQKLLRETAAELNPEPGSIVADLGCGTGNVTNAVLDFEPNLTVHAVDLSEAMIERATSKLGRDPRVTIYQQDLLQWMADQPDDSFDHIVSINVIYVFSTAQRQEFFHHLHRILKPTGRAVIVTTDREGFGPVLREHLREASFWKSLRFRLVAVLIMNLLIWLKESNQQFDPASQEQLESESSEALLSMSGVQRCYGGDVDGVNLRFVVEPVIDLRASTTHEDVDIEPANEQATPQDAVEHATDERAFRPQAGA